MYSLGNFTACSSNRDCKTLHRGCSIDHFKILEKQLWWFDYFIRSSCPRKTCVLNTRAMAANFPGKLLEDLETQNLLELEETKKVLIEIVSSSKNPTFAQSN